jgi:hypothetical protein
MGYAPLPGQQKSLLYKILSLGCDWLERMPKPYSRGQQTQACGLVFYYLQTKNGFHIHMAEGKSKRKKIL